MYWEYIRIAIDSGDLEDINKLGAQGWEVCGIFTEEYLYPNSLPAHVRPKNNFVLLKRNITAAQAQEISFPTKKG